MPKKSQPTQTELKSRTISRVALGVAFVGIGLAAAGVIGLSRGDEGAISQDLKLSNRQELAEEDLCTDSDGELSYDQYFSRGVIDFGLGEVEDFCTEEGLLHEWTCDGDSMSFERVDCGEVRRDYVCEYGRCVHLSEVESGFRCVDTDGELSYDQYLVRGVVTIETGELEDFCTPDGMLHEWTCGGMGVGFQIVDCGDIRRDGVCEDGKCIVR